MGTPPQSSEPPGRLSNKHRLITALVIVGLAAGSAIFMIWIGLRFLAGGREQGARKEGAGQQITIRTPAGPLQVQEGLNPAQLALPIYPGSIRAEAGDSVTLRLHLPNDEVLKVWAAKFETSDPLEQVAKFYDLNLPPKTLHHQASNGQGKTVYEIKQGDENRIVTLERRSGHTWIRLARIVPAAPEKH